MNESTVKRRIWIRNIVIIFLAVLLLLTFFSQTILNYSLPEVSVRYPSWGTISSKVNVTGTVRANQTYDVTIEQTRQIDEILVRVGQQVKKGDVLMTLTDGGSAELAAARKLYDDLTIQLIQKVKADPTGKTSDTADTIRELTDTLASLEKQYAAILAEKGKMPTINELNAAKATIEMEKSTIEALTEEIERLTGKRGQTGGSGFYTEEELSALIAKAEEALADAEAAALSALNAQLTAEATLSHNKVQLETAQESLKDAQKAVSDYEADMPGGSVTMESLMKEYKALGEKEEELETAKNLLAGLKSAESNYTMLKFQHDNFTAKKAEYDSVKADLAKVEADLSAAVKDFDRNELTKAENDYNTAKDAYDESPSAESEKAMHDAWMAYQPLKAQDEKINALWKEQLRLAALLPEKEAAYTEAEKNYNEEDYLAAKDVYDKALAAADGKGVSQLEANVKALDKAYTEAYQTYYKNQFTYAQNSSANDILTGLKSRAETAQERVETLTKAVTDAEESLKEAAEALTKANADKTAAEAEMTRVENFRSYDSLTEQIKQVTKQKTEAEERLAKAEATIAAGTAESEAAITEKLTAKQKEVDDAKKKLTKARADAEKEAETVRLDKMQYDIELKQLQDQVAKQEEEVSRLMRLESDGKITAPASGIIASLPYGAGKEAAANSVVASITLSDAGYTMECTVSAQQAAQIRVGDIGEIQYYYWGDVPRAKVVNIQSPQGSMGQSRTITLEITGQVESGVNLTVALGGKNESYDAVIPSSAIREDQNGKFVLIVTAKSTPLGNRYKAKRVDVEVLASDTVNSAISGDVTGQYIITHSEKPVSSGDAVRLSEE